VPLCTDLDASKEMLHQLQRKADREAAGLSDPFDESGKCPLSRNTWLDSASTWKPK